MKVGKIVKELFLILFAIFAPEKNNIILQQ